MSHEATNWAIKQRGLKPSTKIVLWHLCDRFNPDYGCFPSQERLANDCEISRSTLNEHLGHLEAAGLLRRVPRVHPVTKRQMPTRYILGFEPGFTPHEPDPCPETGHGNAGDVASIADIGPFDSEPPDMAKPCLNSGHGYDARAVSDFGPDPCLENAESRVRNPDTNLVREPLSKPVKEEEGARAEISDDFFAELLAAHALDAMDRAAVAALIRATGAGIVINVAQAFCNMTILEACIETGAAYLDTAIHEEPDLICETPPWYANHEWKRREACAKAGVTAILGIGGNGGAKLGHGSGGIVSLQAE